jgi:sulfatase modifying factor 1
VTQTCADGFCRIPAGCFVMGSPESEPNRAEDSEDLTAVTLTRSFEIGQVEVTRERWIEVTPNVPKKSDAIQGDIASCPEARCPISYVTWADALAFANRVSAEHDPPLEPCYVLLRCSGEIGVDFTCETVALTTSSPYECLGYRLPTEAEWEYAARAGTRTAYYTGDITVSDPLLDAKEANLEEVAWYSANAGTTTHPVAAKRPNRWGLFDMLGNVKEWTTDLAGYAPEGPLQDPFSPFAAADGATDLRAMRGGYAALWPSALRAAVTLPMLGLGPISRDAGMGLRLVRTLPPNE